MRPVRLIVLLAAVIFGLTGIYLGVYEFYRAPVDFRGVKPDYTVTASEIQKQFENDEKTASEKYINKIVEVSGIVASVSETGSNQSNIALKTDNDMSSVICSVKTDPTAGIKEGNKITIRGSCSGYLMDVLLNNCVIVK